MKLFGTKTLFFLKIWDECQLQCVAANVLHSSVLPISHLVANWCNSKAASLHYSPFFAQLRAGELHLVHTLVIQLWCRAFWCRFNCVGGKHARQIEKEWAGGRKQGEGISQEQ